MSDNLMRLFLRRLDEGKEAVAQGVSAFIRSEIKERGLFRRILPPQYVTTGDPNVQRDLDHDMIYYVAEKEPTTFAISLTFAGEPGAVQPKGKRVRIDFMQNSTPKIEKTEQELLAYSYSLHQWIIDNVVKDLEMQEDSLGFKLALAALKNSGQYFDYSPSGEFSKNVILEAASLLDKSRRTGESNIIVVNKATFDQFLKQNATVLGDELAKEVVISGYKYQTILGLNFLITRNNKVIPPGIFYIFSAPEWLGKSPMLGDAKFFVKKEGPKIEYLVWEHYGIGLVNMQGVVCGYDKTGTGSWDADAGGVFYQPGFTGPKYYYPPYPEPEE